MRTNLILYMMGAPSRRKIVETLLKFPDRMWSCSAMEDVTKNSHATVFRIMAALRDYGLVKSIRVNRKDIVYKLVVESPIIHELLQIMSVEARVAKQITRQFIRKVKRDIRCAILYGSAIKDTMHYYSDIDVIIVPKRNNDDVKKRIYDSAGDLSVKVNKTLSILIMDHKELLRERNNAFLSSVRQHMEVMYGKNPFISGNALAKGS